MLAAPPSAGGYNGESGKAGGNGGTVRIEGDTTVTAESHGYAPGIGGGYGYPGGAGSDLTILGNATVEAISAYGVAIGGGGTGASGGTVVLGSLSDRDGGSPSLTAKEVAAGGWGDWGGKGGDFTLYRGTLKADAVACGGISIDGGGGDGGTVTIHGGTLEPHTSGGSLSLANGGSGSNGSNGGNGGEVTLAGGTYTLADALLANGGSGGSGGGKGGDGGEVTLNGGTYTRTDARLANGGDGGDGGENGGDGGNGGKLIIKGGSHNPNGASFVKGGAGGGGTSNNGRKGNDGSTVNGADAVLVLYAVQVGDTPLADTVFTDLVTDPAYTYDMTDTQTDGAGMLYLWLPQGLGTVSLTDEDGNADYKGTPVGAWRTVVGRPVGTFALTGLDAPVKGKTPDTTLDDSTQYTVKTVSWSPNDSSYKTSTVYTATITLEAKAGYTFMAVPENGFTVAGGTASNAAGGNVVTVVYPATGKDGVPDPTGVFTATGPDSGTLTGVTAGLAYSLDGGANWNPVNGSSIALTSVTPEHGVWIKTPATGTTLESEIQKIAVTKGVAVSGVTAQSCTTADNNDGALLGLQSTMEVLVDGSWTSVSGELGGLVPGVYQVRTKAVGTRLSGESSSFTVGAYGVPAPKGTAQDSTIAYRLRSGANQSWQDGDKGLVLVVDTEKGKFMGVGVGGVLIDAGDYSYAGSTLTLRPEYLATLGEGVYNLRIRYSDGAAETAFTVLAGGRVGSASGSGNPAELGGGNVPTPGIPGTKPNPSTGR